MYSGAIEGRPKALYRLSNSGIKEANTVSVSLRTTRNG